MNDVIQSLVGSVVIGAELGREDHECLNYDNGYMCWLFECVNYDSECMCWLWLWVWQ
jgi:hypothetical protein